MNKIFCTSCGHKNIYEVTQPKFCAGCGTGIGGSIAASAPVVEREVRAEVEVDMSGGDSVGSFDLNKLRSQIVAESNNKGMKLGDIMGSAGNYDEGEFVREQSNLPDGSALLEQSKRDCGSIKSSNIIDG